ncbi:MAG: ADP-glyceromanno-heptose 6-epimerase [Bacteroidales bacterium]|nr:ADP-glyceromanno-heptose 6-epimerase [Bacteroidales bacterium]MCF8327240.1 ADP-glyceromanno-heptose 6-epimerase [Bacteroidales bacterium]
MIIVTGAAGFIGSCMISELNNRGYKNIVAVDDFSRSDKNSNLQDKNLVDRINRDAFLEWAGKNKNDIQFIIHLGARTDTAEFDQAIFERLNLNYSKAMWEFCSDNQIPLIYASSAATYGLGEHGYSDDHDIVDKLQPLNAYGKSKNDFDKWMLKQEKEPPFWAGLKFFNVYGPNEYHKSRMASVVYHAFHQISQTGGMKLFRSHIPEFKDGEQSRDFIYVKDVTNMILWLMENKPKSAIYNTGTGVARSFIDLTRAVFDALGKEENIQFIDTPEDIRDKYQYFTKAEMTKLRDQGYNESMTSLEEGVKDYVQNYLVKKKYL